MKLNRVRSSRYIIILYTYIFSFFYDFIIIIICTGGEILFCIIISFETAQVENIVVKILISDGVYVETEKRLTRALIIMREEMKNERTIENLTATVLAIFSSLNRRRNNT